MGGGNGCKAAKTRERNAKNAPKKAAGESKPQAMMICKKCFTQFPYTAREPELRTHCENKHGDFPFDKSFPDYGKIMAEKK